MTRTTWKKLGVGVAVLSIAALGLVLNLPSSDAAAIQVITCDGSKDHLLQLPGLPDILVRTEGHLSAGVGTSFVTTDGRQGTNLTVEDVFSTGKADGLGDVTFKLDRSRTAGRSVLLSNEPGTRFPATQTMQFHFEVTAGNNTYRSLNAASVTNSQIRQFPPARGTVYVLSNELKLEDVNKPGVVAMTMEPGKAFTVR
jgi:hypothetical protein